jgi:D-alanyl-D-alanine carboxypeptidase (penicillin-binding protein 5/6)
MDVSETQTRDRRLGVRVVSFVIAICLLAIGWAGVRESEPRAGSPGEGRHPGVIRGSADAAHAADAVDPGPAALVQLIASGYTIPGDAPRLPWPTTGQAAVEVEGVGSLGMSGRADRPVPIASVAKTMTAYVILEHHPLAAGESGPAITVTSAEAAAYGGQLAEGQSLVHVYAGERISERASLEALMLASADNIANILARWDAGSVASFVASMNAAAARLGMTHTRYADPSGLDPATVSTAADQIKLAETAMRPAGLRGIVAEPAATIPDEGRITNFNRLLGHSGVIGVKTGSTSQAGGCLLFAATGTVGGIPVTIVGAVLGQPLDSGDDFLADTLAAAQRLIAATWDSLTAATIALPGRELAVVRRSGSADLRLGVRSPVTVVGWPGLTYRVSAYGSPYSASLQVTRTVAAQATGESPGAGIPLVGIFSGGATAAP